MPHTPAHHTALSTTEHDSFQPESEPLDQTTAQLFPKTFTRPDLPRPSTIMATQMLPLQRTIGNRAVTRLLAKHSTADAWRSIFRTLAQQTSPQYPLLQRKPENEKPLAEIQGHAMFNLLPKLRALGPEIASDEAAGQAVGGPRLVTAMRVVAAAGQGWMEFATAHSDELAALPSDQISDIITFLGAPKDARYYKADEFGGKFDGAIDPGKGEIVLMFRVRFEVEGARFGSSQSGTPEWEKETKAGIEKYKVDFKRNVEDTWKGTLKPAIPIGKRSSFQARVSVSFVESGEHTLFHIVSTAPDGRSSAKPGEGTLDVDDNEMQVKDKDHPVMNDKGRPAGTVTNTQPPSAHEVGHAFGLDHPQGKGSDDKNYGKTAEERESIMGAGHKMKVVQRGGQIRHNDFAPFIEIAERWGRDVFPGSLASQNKWSGGG